MERRRKVRLIKRGEKNHPPMQDSETKEKVEEKPATTSELALTVMGWVREYQNRRRAESGNVSR